MRILARTCHYNCSTGASCPDHPCRNSVLGGQEWHASDARKVSLQSGRSGLTFASGSKQAVCWRSRSNAKGLPAGQKRSRPLRDTFVETLKLTLELVSRDGELSQLVMQCLPRNSERSGRCRLVAAMPSQLFDDDGALELFHLLR